MAVGTEVHACRDAGPGAPRQEPQPTLIGLVLEGGLVAVGIGRYAAVEGR